MTPALPSRCSPWPAMWRLPKTSGHQISKSMEAQAAAVRVPLGPEGFGPGGTGTLETFPRRQVLARLTDLRTGLKTVKPSLPAETQKKADAVLAALNPAIAAASSKDTVELRWPRRSARWPRRSTRPFRPPKSPPTIRRRRTQPF